MSKFLSKGYLVRHEGTWRLYGDNHKKYTNTSLYELSKQCFTDIKQDGDYIYPADISTSCSLDFDDLCDLTGFVPLKNGDYIDSVQYGWLENLFVSVWNEDMTEFQKELPVLKFGRFKTIHNNRLYHAKKDLAFSLGQPTLNMVPIEREYTLILDSTKNEVRLCEAHMLEEMLLTGYTSVKDAPTFRAGNNEEAWKITYEWIDKNCPQYHP